MHYFYALDLVKAIDCVTRGCHARAAIRRTPHTVIEQSTSDPPAGVGVSFAADIIKALANLYWYLDNVLRQIQIQDHPCS